MTMHLDKTAARIILIPSVIHIAVAAPALVRQSSLDVDEDVTPESEKRGNLFDTLQDLYPVPQMENRLSTTSGISSSQDPSPESGTSQLYNDPTPTSGAPPSQDDTTPAPGDPVHDDLSSESGEFDHVWRWLDDAPSGESGSHVNLVLSSSKSGSESPPSWLSEWVTPPPSPEASEVFFNDAMQQKLKVLAEFGAAAGVSAGIVYGVHKLIKDDSHGVYVSAYFPPTPADI